MAKPAKTRRPTRKKARDVIPDLAGRPGPDGSIPWMLLSDLSAAEREFITAYRTLTPALRASLRDVLLPAFTAATEERRRRRRHRAAR